MGPGLRRDDNGYSSQLLLTFDAPFLPERLEQARDVAGFEAGAGAAGGIVNSGGESLPALLQFEHALFDRALRDELVDEDGRVRADPVGAVGRLVLDGRIPPRIVMRGRF